MNWSNFLFFILGSLVTFFVTAYFYKRQSNETPTWFSLSSIKEILAKNPNDINWSAKQIVNLFKKKVYKESDEPLPYNYCPECGSSKLKGQPIADNGNDELYYSILCEDCGWSDWTQ